MHGEVELLIQVRVVDSRWKGTQMDDCDTVLGRYKNGHVGIMHRSAWQACDFIVVGDGRLNLKDSEKIHSLPKTAER